MSHRYIEVSHGSVENLHRLFGEADVIDRREGRLAYRRYHKVLRQIAREYRRPFPRVVAAFVAMSPNSGYYGNLRSLISVLDGLRDDVPREQVTISTYKHCRDRAWSYLTGEANFLKTVKGLKIRSFYLNILDPRDPHNVTVDGHMVAAWLGQSLTMKEALLRGPRAYHVVADGVREVAAEHGLLPHQMQATLWFARKRTLKVMYDPQIDIFGWQAKDIWRTVVPLTDIPPYPRQEKGSTGALGKL